MKTVTIATLSLLLSTTSVQAQDLVYVASGDDGSNYSVDRQYMKYYPEKELVGFIYTNRLREPNEKGVLFNNYSVLAECGSKNLLVLGGNSYGEKNNLIYSGKFQYFQKPEKGSPNYKAVQKVCLILGVN